MTDIKKLQKHIENDPIIRDRMVKLGCLLLCTFDNFLAPVLAAIHLVINLDRGNEDECYKSH